MQRKIEKNKNYFRYLPCSVTDISWQLFTTTVGHVEINPGENYPYNPNGHPVSYILNWSRGRILSEFQFVYITKGAGRFRSFQGEFAISMGTVILLVPGERHWYMPDPDTGWEEYWLGFNGASADNWMKQKFIDGSNPLYHPGVKQSLTSLFDQAVMYAKQEPVCMQQLISSLIPQILALLYASRSGIQQFQEHNSLLEKARTILEENIYNQFDVEAISKALKVNYYTLRDYFNRHTGMSPYQYFLQMKINKAKELLIRGDLSVKEVSYKLAFDNPYYFSRLFKKKTGTSPSKWNGLAIKNDLELWDEN